MAYCFHSSTGSIEPNALSMALRGRYNKINGLMPGRIGFGTDGAITAGATVTYAVSAGLSRAVERF